MPATRTNDSRPRASVAGELKRVGVVPRLMLLASIVALGIGIFFWLKPAPDAGDARPAPSPDLASTDAERPRAAGGSGVDPRLASGLVSGLAGSTAPGAAPSSGLAAPGIAGGTADTQSRSADAASSDTSPWSGTMMRVGGSFTAAFIIAFLLRSFVRIGLFVAAIVAGGLFLLERTGVIGVDWSMFQRGAEDAAGWVGDRSDEVMAFLKKAVPSGTAAAVGFWSGFRRG